MNWLEKMNAAVTYIEENLTGEIDYAVIAQKACTGPYQFQRIFSFVVDVPLAEYIRRRRLTLAAFDLQSSAMKVIDIALKYGYESPEAFARAFQALHGVTPTMARISGTKLKAYARISFQISIKGDAEVNYRIEKCNKMVIQGMRREFDLAEEEKCYREIPELWHTLCSSGELDKLVSLAGINFGKGDAYPVRACSAMRNDGMKFSYIVGIAGKTENPALAQYETLAVPAGGWVVFTTEKVPMSDIAAEIQRINKQVYTEWLPTSKYECGNYEQEIYYMDEQGLTFCEVWLAVKEKDDK